MVPEEDSYAFDIYTKYENLGSVRSKLEELGYVVKEAELIKEANLLKSLSGIELEKTTSALEKLEENDDVQNVWSDLE